MAFSKKKFREAVKNKKKNFKKNFANEEGRRSM